MSDRPTADPERPSPRDIERLLLGGLALLSAALFVAGRPWSPSAENLAAWVTVLTVIAALVVGARVLIAWASVELLRTSKATEASSGKAPLAGVRPMTIVLAVLGVAVVVWGVPHLQLAGHDLSELERLHELDKLRDTLAKALFGLGGIVVVYLTARRIEAVERTAESAEANVKTAANNLLLVERGQVTERFTTAVEQLGNTKRSIRLGGIYALERIAQDSPERDHCTVMEVLTAFVREKAPIPEHEDPDGPQPPATDVQAALTVIGRRSEAQRQHEGPTHRLDLAWCRLSKADLSGAHLERADLRHTHLEGAKLVKARMEGAELASAHLEEADLDYAHMEKANLLKAHLERADLNRAHLEGANLVRSHLEGAILLNARLDAAHLDHAHLEGTHFHYAHLDGASLFKARMDGANLLEAKGLTEVQIRSCHFDERTRWPDELQDFAKQLLAERAEEAAKGDDADDE